MIFKVILGLCYFGIGVMVYTAAHKAHPETERFALLIAILWPAFFIFEFICELFLFIYELIVSVKHNIFKK